MKITDDMLKIAVAKTVEAGLLPRRALKEDFEQAQHLMRMILESAFDTMPIAVNMESENDSAEPATHLASIRNDLLAVDLL